MKKTCLRGYDQAGEFKDIMMTNEVFDKLSDEQMEVLHKEGILQHIIKKNQMHKGQISYKSVGNFANNIILKHFSGAEE